ncbi:unnamed protein product [Heterobilharzia americana]|nr:unnamed protein product [Heterobilharzia americana]
MESNDPPTNTVSGELHMKVDTESIAVSGDVCSENNVPYGVVSTSSCHVPTVSNFVNDDEITSVIDDSHTPATSLSASQLLKLKRLQDETSRPVSRRDSRSPHRSSHTSLQVQSPGNPVTTRSQNQSQQPEPETGYTQCLQPSQFPQPEQSLQYNQPSMVQNTPGLNSDLRSFSVHLNQELSNRNNPKLEIDDKDDDEDDDMEDFELKNITKVFEPPNVTSFQPTSLPTHKLTSSRFLTTFPHQ